MTIDEILRHFDGVKGGHGQYKAKCPAHMDADPSLSIGLGRDGRVLIHCFAGCRTEDILDAVGLRKRDLFAEDWRGAPLPEFEPIQSDSREWTEAEYLYPGGNLKKVKKRAANGKKRMYWMRRTGDGWTPAHGDVEKLLYTRGPLDSPVFLVEGEKDVDTLHALGFSAASLPDGANSKWYDPYGAALAGKDVFLIQDNDKPGKAFAARIAGELLQEAWSVRVLDLTQAWPELPEHGDVTDLLDYLGKEAGCDALAALMHSAQPWTAETAQKQQTAVPTQGGAADIQRLHIISAPELQVANLPPVRYMVEGMLPEGIGLLSAASKTGKSWMVLSMGLKIAAGEPFMGHQTNQCGVLYLALEDSLSRLQDRMNKILKGRPAPPLFYFTTEAPNLDQGLLATLDDHIQQHPETKLIIIDTLQKIRGQALPREASYAQDYREMGMVKAHMDKKGVSVFFVHHNRKMADEGDPFNMISGTNGIMGAADTIFVITKDKRADQEATLHITGRDVEQSDTVIQFNKDTWEWEVVGAADWLQEQRERLAYESSPIVKTIKKLLEQSPEHRWDGTCKELLEAGQYIAHTYLAATPQKLGYELRNLDKPLLKRDGIIHVRPPNGTGGKKHCFYYQDFGLLEELPDDELVPFSNM